MKRKKKKSVGRKMLSDVLDEQRREVIDQLKKQRKRLVKF